MKQLIYTCLPFALLCFSCATMEGTATDTGSSGSAVQASAPVPVTNLNETKRERLLEAVSSLEGRWSNPEMGETVFEISSAGSVVREIMNPGHEMEMTNMYSLDGNDLRMVHYCGIGNQPHMRASTMMDNKIVFRPDGVTDWKGPEQVYMGAMTLHFVDENHFEEHWTSFANGKEGEPMVMKFERVD